MILRSYISADLDELLTLFYETVHTVNARDYTPQQLDAWADGAPDLIAFFALPVSPAPIFCATTVAIPEPRFVIGSNITVSTRYAVVIADTVCAPKLFMNCWRMRLPMELALDCMAGGNPKAAPSPTACASSILPKPGLRSGYLRNVYMTMNIAIAACEMAVAAAAPLVPYPSPATKSRSSTTFAMDDTMIARKGALLLPMPRNTAE